MLALASRPFACLVLLLHKIFDNARTSVGVKNYSVRFASVCDRKINGIHCKLCIDFIRQLVGNNFS